MDDVKTHIKCEYPNITSIIRLLPIFETRLKIIECYRETPRKAIFKVYDNKVNRISTAKFVIKFNIKQTQVELITKIINNPHYNIFDVYEIGEISMFYIILATHVDGMTFNKYMKKCEDKRTLLNIIIQVLEGIDYLNKMKLIHTDIKPDNIIITHDGTPRIIDLDTLIYMKRPSMVLNAIIGTKPYIPKEIIEDHTYHYESDIWSFGLTCLVSIAEKYNSENIKDNINIEKESSHAEIMDINREFIKRMYGNTIHDLICLMLNDLQKRPTAKILLKTLETLKKYKYIKSTKNTNHKSEHTIISERS
jgi:serine/threonine protein kinase